MGVHECLATRQYLSTTYQRHDHWLVRVIHHVLEPEPERERRIYLHIRGANYRTDWPLSQGLWSIGVLSLRRLIVHVRVRQVQPLASSLPQESSANGDHTSHEVHSRHGRPHGTLVRGRGTRLRQDVRHARSRSWTVVYVPAVPALYPLHRLLHLLDPSRLASSSRLQTSSQGSSQVDHADAFCQSRLSSFGWLPTGFTLSYLSFSLPHAKTRLHRALSLHQRLDHHDSYVSSRFFTYPSLIWKKKL